MYTAIYIGKSKQRYYYIGKTKPIKEKKRDIHIYIEKEKVYISLYIGKIKIYNYLYI